MPSCFSPFLNSLHPRQTHPNPRTTPADHKTHAPLTLCSAPSSAAITTSPIARQNNASLGAMPTARSISQPFPHSPSPSGSNSPTPHSLAWSPDCALLWSSGLTLPIQPHTLPPNARNTPPNARNTPSNAQPPPSSAKNTPLSPSGHPAQYAIALLHQKDRLAWCTPQGTIAWRALSHTLPSPPPINRSSAFPNADAPSPCHRLFHHPHAPALLALFSQTIVLFQTHTASAEPIQPIQTIDLSADPLVDADLDPQQHLLVTLHQSGRIRRWRWNTQPLK